MDKSPVRGVARKRPIDEYDAPARSSYVGGSDDRGAVFGSSSSSEHHHHLHHHRRSSLHGLPADYFAADVHSGGLQSNNLQKSRRLVSEFHDGSGADDMLRASIPSSSREVLAPLVATGSPGPPALMSEPLHKATAPNANPFLPHQPASVAFSTPQLDNFRLDATGNVAQKENKSRVLKPVPKRILHHGSSHSTPRIQPASLPAISQFLSPNDPARATNAAAQGAFPSAFGKPSAFMANSKAFPPFRGVLPSSALLASSTNAESADRSAPSTPAITACAEPGIMSEVGIAFGADDCSSDEEFSMDNEISLSQDKLNNLSVHDIPDYLLENDDRASGAKAPTQNSQVFMQLAPGFVGTLSEQEERGLKEIGAFTVPLQLNPDPIVLGRDHFYPIFGDKIRGCETFHLSRKHCVFHVTRADSTSTSKQYKVMVENTSTNGLEVNGRQMKNLEQRELHTGDTVTLLRIRNHGVDISLAYTLVVKHDAALGNKANPWPVQARRSPRFARAKANGRGLGQAVKKPRATGNSHPFGLPASPPKKRLKFPVLHVDILIADPFIAVSESPRHTSRGHRDELSAAMAALSSVDRLKTTYECATKEALFAAVQNRTRVVIYAGSSESNRVLVEDQAGMPAYVDVVELATAAGDDESKNQLVVVFAKHLTTGQLFVEAGFQHVIFVNASDRCRAKSASYLKALLASILKGTPVGEAHSLARRVALGESAASPASSDCLCGILPGGKSHDVAVGDYPKKSEGAATETSLPILDAMLIPSLPAYHIAQDALYTEVIGALRTRKIQVCTLRGDAGIGKSSTAVYVAKYATDRRWYKNGVHYIDVESAFKKKGDSSNDALGWTGDVSDSDETRQRITRRIQEDVDELLQTLRGIERTDAGSNSTLIVLDGCDRLNPVRFRDFILKTVQSFPGVQIMVTMRQILKINTHTKVVEECAFQLKELSPKDTATVFLAMAKACLEPDRLRLALSEDSHDALAKHPTLVRLKGNPLLLSRTVLRLRTSTLDELE